MHYRSWTLCCCLILMNNATSHAQVGLGEVLQTGDFISEVPLWEGVPPGSEQVDSEARYEQRGSEDRSNRWSTGVTRPILSVYAPAPDKSTGAAVVVLPGGGYGGHAIDKEGHFVARWLSERGVVGVVCPYRCGGGPHQHPAPMDDAQRAIQSIRSMAETWDIDPDAIGVMGFSAGGHLAATTATQWLDADSQADDPVRRVTSRPDFAVLVYPVISMRPEVSHGGSHTNLLGENASEELIASLSADERVTAQTPPTLLIHSADDGAVPVENPLRFFRACRKHEVPVEMHLYESGGHGYGMWADKGTVADWPAAFESWLVARGYAVRGDGP